MPEFIPQHIPEGVDPFTRGYLAAFEWLLPDDPSQPEYIDRTKIRGWSRDALRKIKADCRDFQRANKELIATYCEQRRKEKAFELRRKDDPLESAGHDFFLTREGHGSGFWDRGHHSVFRRLSEAAKTHGPAGDPWLSRGKLRID